MKIKRKLNEKVEFKLSVLAISIVALILFAPIAYSYDSKNQESKIDLKKSLNDFVEKIKDMFRTTGKVVGITGAGTGDQIEQVIEDVKKGTTQAQTEQAQKQDKATQQTQQAAKAAQPAKPANIAAFRAEIAKKWGVASSKVEITDVYGDDWKGGSYRAVIQVDKGAGQKVSFLSTYKGSDKTGIENPEKVFVKDGDKYIQLEGADKAKGYVNLDDNAFTQKFNYDYVIGGLKDTSDDVYEIKTPGGETYKIYKSKVEGRGDVAIEAIPEGERRSPRVFLGEEVFDLDKIPTEKKDKILPGGITANKVVNSNNLYRGVDGKYYDIQGKEVNPQTLTVFFSDGKLSVGQAPEKFVDGPSFAPAGGWKVGDITEIKGEKIQYIGPDKWKVAGTNEEVNGQRAAAEKMPIGESFTRGGIEYTMTKSGLVSIDPQTKKITYYDDQLRPSGVVDLSTYQGPVSDLQIKDNQVTAKFGGLEFTVQKQGEQGGYRLEDSSDTTKVYYYNKQGQQIDGSEAVTLEGEQFNYNGEKIPLWIAQEITGGQNLGTPAGQAAFKENYEKLRAEKGDGLKEVGKGNYILGDTLYLKSKQSFDLGGLPGNVRTDILNNADNAKVVGSDLVIDNFGGAKDRNFRVGKSTSGFLETVLTEPDKSKTVTTIGDTFTLTEKKKIINGVEVVVSKEESYEQKLPDGSTVKGKYYVELNEHGIRVKGNGEEKTLGKDGKVEKTITYTYGQDEEKNPTLERHETDSKGNTKDTTVTRSPDGSVLSASEEITETDDKGQKRQIETKYKGGEMIDENTFRSTDDKITHQKITETETEKFGEGINEKAVIELKTIREADGPAQDVPASVTKISVKDESGAVLTELNIAKGSDQILKGEPFIQNLKTLSPGTIERMVKDNSWNDISKKGTALSTSDGREIKLDSVKSKNPVYTKPVEGFKAPNGNIYTQDYTQSGTFVEYLRDVQIGNLWVLKNFGQDTSADGKEAVIYAYYTWKPYAVVKGDKIVLILETADGVEFYDVNKGKKITECDTNELCRAAKKRYEDSRLGIDLERTFRMSAGITATLKLLGIKMPQWGIGKLVDSLLFVELFQDPGDTLCRTVGGFGDYKKPSSEEFTEDGIAGYTSSGSRYAMLAAIKSDGVTVACSENSNCNSTEYACNINNVCQKGIACSEDSEGYDARYGICPAEPVEFQKEQLYKITFWLKALNNDLIFRIYMYKDESELGTANGLKVLEGKLPAGKEVSTGNPELFKGSVKYMEENYNYICIVFDGGKLCNKIAVKTAEDAETYAGSSIESEPVAGEIGWSW